MLQLAAGRLQPRATLALVGLRGHRLCLVLALRRRFPAPSASYSDAFCVFVGAEREAHRLPAALSTHIYLSLYACMYIYIYICIHTYMCICIIYIYIYVSYVCMYVYIYIYM